MNTAKKKSARKPRVLVMESGFGSVASCVRQAGCTAITVSPRCIEDVDEALAAGFDALLLTGGGDIDPRLYGQKPHKKVYGVSETRDYTEWMALDRAAELGVPVLGICRGHQLMSVHNGGELRQHIGGHRGGEHPVLAIEGSRFEAIIGQPKGRFPSLHHQVVNRHGDGWRVAARSPEGLIEAVESRDGRCLGVQFHPEYDHGYNPASRRIFLWLALTAAKRAGLPKPKPQAPPKPKPKQLTLAAPPKRARTTIGSRWYCRGCGLLFDHQRDRDDHEDYICGGALIDRARARAQEPPPGHPDWERR